MRSVTTPSRLRCFLEWSKTPLSADQTFACLFALSVATNAAWLPPLARQNLVQHLPALAQVQAVLSPQPAPVPAVLTNYQITLRVIRPRAVHTFTVNSTADFADATAGNGVCQTSSLNGAVCTLRASIQEANASGGDDAIVFAANVRGTITLTLGELLVTDSVTITGPGAGNLAVSGNNAARVFRIGSGSTALSGLTIRDGRATAQMIQTPAGVMAGGIGGGIFNQSTLSVDSCVVTNNRGIGGSSGTGNNRVAYGGGISNGTYIPTSTVPATSLTITNSTISNNSVVGGDDRGSAYGGGIQSAMNSTLTVSNSTINGNSARGGYDGFMGSEGNGGGIDCSGSTNMTLTNTTVSDNVTTGGNDDSGGRGGYGGGIQTQGKHPDTG